MKIAAVTPVYNEPELIEGCIRALEPFVERHIVLISEKPYFGQNYFPDHTEDVAEDLGAEVIKGDWELDHHQRNLGISLLQDFDWILTFDADEMITKKEMKRLVSVLEQTESDAVAVRPEVYWKTTDYVLRPTPDFTPIIAVRPSVKFTHIRNVNVPYELCHIEMHHLSWCSPKDILKKVTTYAHATDFNGEEWYENHYRSWHEQQSVTLPTGTFEVKKNPLPDELKRLLP